MAAVNRMEIRCAAAIIPLLCFPDKALAALWAGNLQFAFAARDPKQVAAAGASEKLMCFTAFQICEKHFKLLLDRPPEPKKLVVFSAPLRNIARKEPEYNEYEKQIGHIHQKT